MFSLILRTGNMAFTNQRLFPRVRLWKMRTLICSTLKVSSGLGGRRSEEASNAYTRDLAGLLKTAGRAIMYLMEKMKSSRATADMIDLGSH